MFPPFSGLAKKCNFLLGKLTKRYLVALCSVRRPRCGKKAKGAATTLFRSCEFHRSQLPKRRNAHFLFPLQTQGCATTARAALVADYLLCEPQLLASGWRIANQHDEEKAGKESLKFSTTGMP